MFGYHNLRSDDWLMNKSDTLRPDKLICDYDIFVYTALDYLSQRLQSNVNLITPQIAKFMGLTWGSPGSCRPQMGPMLAPWTLLSGTFITALCDNEAVICLSMMLTKLKNVFRERFILECRKSAYARSTCPPFSTISHRHVRFASTFPCGFSHFYFVHTFTSGSLTLSNLVFSYCHFLFPTLSLRFNSTFVLVHSHFHIGLRTLS